MSAQIGSGYLRCFFQRTRNIGQLLARFQVTHIPSEVLSGRQADTLQSLSASRSRGLASESKS